VAATFQLHSGDAEIGWMLAVVVDYRNVIQKQPGAVVRQQGECITTGFINPETTVVVDREPFEARR
jgi:hypothetical protein